MSWLKSNKAVNAIKGMVGWFAPGQQVKNMRMINNLMNEEIQSLTARLKTATGAERDEIAARLEHLRGVRGSQSLNLVGAYLDENPFRAGVIGGTVGMGVLAWDSRRDRR